MNEFEKNCREAIVLGELLSKEDFRGCFVEHFGRKLEKLGEGLPSGVSLGILQRLQVTLLKPLMVHLETTKNSKDKLLLVECVKKVLALTPVHHPGEFFEVYSLVFYQIYVDGNLPYRPSEELQVAVLECCSFLIRHSTQAVLDGVYLEESAMRFSMGISISVCIVKEEKSIKLRLAALDFLLTASRFDADAKYEHKMYKKVGDVFMLYLPGILSPLLEVISRDETQHHLITVRALSCWGHILCLVMKDSSESDQLSETEVIKQWLQSQKITEEKILDVKEGLKERKRSKAWLESAAVALHPLLLKISDVRKHSNPKCRLELTRIMAKLSRNCARNLKNSLPSIIEVLVSSSVDKDEEVSRVAEKALGDFEAECNQRSVSIFVSVIEENLYSVVNKLPRVAQSGNEQLILSSLKSFSGYLRILGRLRRLEQLICLSSTLRKLISVVQIASELEVYPEISNKDFSVLDNEVNSQTWWKPWKRFRHFADRAIESQLEEICRCLGEFGPAEEILDFLLDTYARERTSRKELLLVTNEVVAGAGALPDHVVKQVLDFYLDPENLYPPLEVDGRNCFGLREAHSNIMTVALIMEGIGKLARSIGERFQDHLLASLYYVLEKMGSSFAVIREAATKSAGEIADACGSAGDVRALIRNNVDYLTYHLTIKLRRKEGSVFDVVAVLLKNSPFETLPNIEEIIEMVLRSSSEDLDSPHTISYLRLFQTFVVCVNGWSKTAAAELPPKTRPAHSCRTSGLEGLKKYLERFRGEPEEEDLPEEDDAETVPEEPEGPRLPRHLELTVSVANHSLHFLPSKDKDKKLIVLEILDGSVRALADWENDLLPLVHKIWSPLVTRFDRMRDPLLINRSFGLLCTLCDASKDFIRSRTLKNVLPALESFLLRQAAESKLKDSSSGYFFTQGFKLQRQLLEKLGKLASDLNLFERQADLVADCALPYLSGLQPRELQDKCRVFFEDLKAHDPYLVWFKVHGLTGSPECARNARLVLNSIKSVGPS